ncbi:arsenate reductase (glutaredoxin) [Marinobacterium weihaiense]|uniref:Arsenate reductase n=1 Tax=Marinobacterium weihaiense TaxID=2851016 RepID=A0ABS6MBV7_9GAMM|nr:arsenate reductase (glutaredoxin) [Marinobacterium weihaiense]MBV0933730.1 arsenate reductase (glutaredoxin) [Marinobacterium weihaiense]
MSITLYHNPRCSKSRETLKLLQERGIEPEIREYLKDVPTADEIKAVLDALGMAPRELLRVKESEYKDAGLDNQDLDDAAVIQAMTLYPRLIERPIVINGDRARIGRPPESVLEILA